MNFPVVQLGDLCEMDRRGLDPDDSTAAELRFVGVENIESQNGVLNFANGSRVGSQRSTTFRFDERHVLYAKLRPYLNKVAVPDFAGRCSTELVPLRPREGVDREFVAHLLRRQQTIEYVMASVTGSRMPRTDMKALMLLPVPHPPLDEQRRIAGILNRAAKIERLRTRAQERLREFLPALFVNMFGDPATNPMGWDKVFFGNIVTDTTRKVTKVQKKNYANIGEIPIVDQGAELIAGYASDKRGYYDNNLPAIIFGDHTKRFKLIQFPFFLGADGAKVLLPNCHDLDPVFLYGQFGCLELEDAGYSRHFKFLKSKELILPPIEQQKRFRTLSENATIIADSMGEATTIATALSASLMSRLLEDAA